MRATAGELGGHGVGVAAPGPDHSPLAGTLTGEDAVQRRATSLGGIRLRGKKPKLSPRQESHLVELHHAGAHTSAELAELFSVAREIERARTAAPTES